MKPTQRAVIWAAAAVTALVPAAPTTATVASASSAQVTARAAKGCITVTATIRVGRDPVGAAANPKTNTIYVANFGGNRVSVINGRTNTVTATIRVGREPFGVAVNPKTNTIYVAKFFGTVSVINGR